MKEEKVTWNILSQYRKELMGCSILGIILFHWYENCTINAIYPGGMLKELVQLSKFVDVFLMLSGIGLYYSFRKNKDTIIFYLKRFGRVLPSYLILAVPYWICYDVLYAGRGIKGFLKDITFITFLTEGNRRFWFIGVILVFYLIFPLIYKSIYSEKKEELVFALWIVGYLILAFGIWKIWPELYNHIEIGLGRVPSFLTGVYIGSKVYEKKPIKISVYIILVILWIVMYLVAPHCHHMFVNNLLNRNQGVFWALSVTIALGYVLNLLEKSEVYQKTLKPVLNFLGELTMEIYILHVAFALVNKFWTRIIKK